ncbi:hypothetical protein [Derxia gummosa]|uniref:LemA protein n=1 Tax=Derxia gummosa DSM 723 TaxID=1121388 RepID=A0A8B6X261_9BURK|nr:hypothetical protein [Derxia gummosa]
MSPDALLTAAALLLPGFWAVGARRRMLDLRQAARAAWLRVDERLKTRHELLLRFVEAAAVALPESAEQVAALAAARNSAAAARQGAAIRPGVADALDQLARAEAALDAALARLVEPALAWQPSATMAAAVTTAGARAADDPASGAAALADPAPGTPDESPAPTHPFLATPAGMAQTAEQGTEAPPPAPGIPLFPPPALFDELDAVCTQLDVARHAFNAAVESYDAAVDQYPARLLALPLRLRPLATAAMLGSRAPLAPLVTPAPGEG